MFTFGILNVSRPNKLIIQELELNITAFKSFLCIRSARQNFSRRNYTTYFRNITSSKFLYISRLLSFNKVLSRKGLELHLLESKLPSKGLTHYQKSECFTPTLHRYKERRWRANCLHIHVIFPVRKDILTRQSVARAMDQ